jgi:serine/threonine-protein kinase haspin
VHEAHSIVGQVLFALAFAECELQFEHRDLHVGNILVKPTASDALYTVKGEVTALHTHGLAVRIIDYTNSHMRRDGCTLYTDLSDDPVLFDGPRGEEYQYEVYRLMRERNGYVSCVGTYSHARA